MMWFLYATVALIIYVFLSSIKSFIKNYSAAKKTGLPIIISPVQRLNVPWILAQQSLAPVLAQLPFGLGSFTRYSTLAYWFQDKYRLHEQVGKTFMYVSPGMNELHSADPFVNEQIFARKKDFEKSEDILKATKIYGDSVVTVAGPDWQRHRRITTSPFNERNNKLVWDESIRQTQQVMAYWSKCGPAGFSTTTHDWTIVTLNILATAAFGESWDFLGTEEHHLETIVESQRQSKIDSNMEMSSRASIAILASSVRLLTLTPRWFFSVPPSLMPTNSLKQFVAAHTQFEQCMKEMVGKKKAEIASGQVINDATFLSTLILKSEEAQREKHAPGSSRGGLSEDEIYGNLFFYHIAGHETTAGVLGYALYLLAAFPEWQHWVHEEVDVVYQPHIDVNKMDYKETSPRLKRCLAVMLEVLRLYGPTQFVVKSTIGPQGQDLEVEGKTCRIPPNTLVMPNGIASQTLPEYWGEDTLEWKPARWIESKTVKDNDSSLKGYDGVAEESVLPPAMAEETFLPWSGGGRVCPGKRFSQVEFVAIISLLLSRYAIDIVPREGESEQKARERCFAVINNSASELTLQMKDPTSVRLRLIARN